MVRARRHTSTPASPGITQSRMASLGASGCCMASQASAPSTVTTTSSPCFFNTPARTRRDVTSSSAMRILTGAAPGPRAQPQPPQSSRLFARSGSLLVDEVLHRYLEPGKAGNEVRHVGHRCSTVTALTGLLHFKSHGPQGLAAHVGRCALDCVGLTGRALGVAGVQASPEHLDLPRDVLQEALSLSLIHISEPTRLGM